MLSCQDFRMNPGDEYFFVMRAIKYADSTPFRNMNRCAPKIVMIEFFSRGAFKTGDLASLRIHTGHHVFDRAIFPGGVERLEYDEERVSIIGVKDILLLGKLFNVRQ